MTKYDITVRTVARFQVESDKNDEELEDDIWENIEFWYNYPDSKIYDDISSVDISKSWDNSPRY